MRKQRLLVACAVALVSGITLVLSIIALDDALIVLGDRPATATVLEVGQMRRSRTGRYYDVRLRVAEPDAPPLEAWADRALKVTGGWSNPPRQPEPGDAVAVYLGADPPRIVPADSVGSRWSWIGPLGFGWALTAAVFLVARRLWRGR